MNIRSIAQGSLLVCLSVLFQLLPTAFGEAFIIATILSAIPIYVMSRLNPKVGFIGYIVAGVLIILLNTHEGLFFIFTNGVVGFSIGAFSYLLNSKLLISILSGFILTLSLSLVNFIAGIPVLGINLPGNLLIQISIIIVFSIIYCFIYLLLANFIYNYLKRRYPFN